MEDVFSPSIKPFDCLNGNLHNCIMNPVPCHNVIKFTKSGALIHSRTQILGMLVGDETSLILLGTEGKYLKGLSTTFAQHNVDFSQRIIGP